jgi:hypothetical protein
MAGTSPAMTALNFGASISLSIFILHCDKKLAHSELPGNF